MTEQLYYTLALSRVKNVGPVLGKTLVEYCGSAEAAFKEKANILLKIPGVGIAITHSLNNSTLLKRTDKEISFIEKNQVKVLSYFDTNYPEQLKHCIDAPLILFYKGKIDPAAQRPISIVGTRQMTAYGREFLQNFMRNLIPYRPTIISGLAYGVDVHAHRLALENQLDTLAVLGHGFDHLYPRTHKEIAQKIIQNKGALITEFWSGTPPLKENFVMRNRIVAGMAQATLVIESANRGGSLITADFANNYHRDVFALPGRVTDAFSAGCNQLIKTNRAAVLSSVKDLCYLLNWVPKGKDLKKSRQKKMFVKLEIAEQQIYDYLLQEGKQSLDLIALHCNYPINKTTGVLLSLELKVLVRPLPGKYYEAI